MKCARRIRPNLFGDVWGFALLMYPFSARTAGVSDMAVVVDVIDL